MSPNSVKNFNQFKFDKDQDKTKKALANVIRLVNAHFEPVKNGTHKLVKFNNMIQDHLSIHQFITKAQTQAANFYYGEMRTS